MSWKRVICGFSLVLFGALSGWAEGPKRLLLIGDGGSHERGAHEHMPGLRVLAKCLADVPNLEVSIYEAGENWPEGPELIRQADGIVLFLDQAARWEQLDAKRKAAVEDLMKRGGGVTAIHSGIMGKDPVYIPFHLDLVGACHGGPDRKYIHTDTKVTVVAKDHPITTGVDDFQLNDEFYYNLKRTGKGKLTELLTADIEGRPEMCAWAFERPDGGRSFGICMMHAHANWGKLECRRLITQGVLWSLGLPIPKNGAPVEIDEADLKLD